MTLGFTGTRHGCTPAQLATLEATLLRLAPDLAVHGDCCGADAEFDALCVAHGIERRARPGKRLGHPLRAGCDAETVLPVRPPLERNGHIITDADVMVACPAEATRQPSGGTWRTIVAAHEAGVRLIIVYPSGRSREWPARDAST